MTVRSRHAATFDLAYRDVPSLVLGGSGFIGAWTARILIEHGATVTVAARNAARTAAALGDGSRAVQIEETELTSRGAVRRLVAATQPSIVFNLAGYGVDRSERDVELMETLNARIVDDLCSQLVDSPDRGWTGVRLVHAGSALEYGPIAAPLGEDVEENPTSDYGRTKLQGTRIVQAAGANGFRGVVARLFTVYGPGEHANRLLPALMETARTGTRLDLTSGRQCRDFTYVADAAEGLLRLGIADARPGEIVNLATGRLSSVREFAETAASVLGLDTALLNFGARPDLADEMWHGDVDVRRLRELTSWVPPTSTTEGIRRAWEFNRGR